MLRADDVLSHRQSLRGGGGDDVGQGRVDEHLVVVHRLGSVVHAALKLERQALLPRPRRDVVKVLAVAKDVQLERVRHPGLAGVVLLDAPQELVESLAPHHLAQEVAPLAENLGGGPDLLGLGGGRRLTLASALLGPAPVALGPERPDHVVHGASHGGGRGRVRVVLRRRRRGGGESLAPANLQEHGRHAVYVHSLGPRKVLDGVGELDDLVAVRPADPRVDEPHRRLLDGAVLLQTRVLEVVCVDDADDVPELVAPSAAGVVPVEVLGFLEHRHVVLPVAYVLGHVPDGDDAVLIRGVPPRVKVELHLWLKPAPLLHPLLDVLSLLLGGVEYHVRVHHLLLRGREPRHHERHLVETAPREIRGSKQRVNRRAGHPRQRRGGDDGHRPTRVPEAAVGPVLC